MSVEYTNFPCLRCNGTGKEPVNPSSHEPIVFLAGACAGFVSAVIWFAIVHWISTLIGAS